MAEQHAGATPRRTVIVGPGAIGITLAVHLSRGGRPVTVLDHRPDRAERIRAEGLRLLTEDGLVTATVSAAARAADVAVADLIIVCVKCPALERAGRSLADLPESSTIVTIQNGLGVIEALARGLGQAAARHTLLAAVTYQAASPTAEGTIRHVANLPTLFDGAPAVRKAADMAADTFESAGLPARVEADLRETVWRKLIVNVAINPLTALERVPNGVVAERSGLRERMRALAREVARVARAEGRAITDREAERSALKAARETAANISSMLQDVEAGRPTEIEFLGGALLRLADEHGLDVPHLHDVTEAIRRLGP